MRRDLEVATANSHNKKLQDEELITRHRTEITNFEATLESKEKTMKEKDASLRRYQKDVQALETQLNSTKSQISHQKGQVSSGEGHREIISAKNALIRGLEESLEVQKHSIVLLEGELKKKREVRKPAHRPILRCPSMEFDGEKEEEHFERHTRAMNARMSDFFVQEENESARFQERVRSKLQELKLQKADNKARKERFSAAMSSSSVQCNEGNLPPPPPKSLTDNLPSKSNSGWLEMLVSILLIMMFFWLATTFNFYAILDQRPFGVSNSSIPSIARLFDFDKLSGRNGTGGWVMPG